MDVGLHRQPGCWLRSSHSFKECVIAHWSSDSAPKISGAKTYYRSYGIIYEGSGSFVCRLKHDRKDMWTVYE